MLSRLQLFLKKPMDFVKTYVLLEDCSNFNSLEVRRASRTKEQAREMFARHDIPHAKGRVFVNPMQAIRFVQEHGFPVCVKPNFGGFSRGSFFPIRTYKELAKALVLVKGYWPKTVIETYLRGKNYRVLVIGGKIAAITQRYPAFITGDGKSSIRSLILKENSQRKKMKIYPVMSPIPIEGAKKYLQKNNLTLNHIPKKHEVVELGNKVALAAGGIVENIPLSRIPKKNRDMFLRILKLFDAQVFGIDVIFEKGITKDYDKQKCIVLEVNSRPYIKMHKYPRYGKPIDLTPFTEGLEEQS